jgi:hypothetical protein
MKVIMLDIDGCLNSERFYCNRIQWKYRKFFDILKALKIFNIWKYINRTDESYYLDNLDKEALLFLKDIIDSVDDCKIVISSSWRYGEEEKDIEYFNNLFNKIVDLGNVVIGSTPRTNERMRGREIELWLENYKNKFNEEIENYVIIDDDSDFYDYQILKHFVHCDNEFGLTKNKAYKVKYILNGNKHLYV